MDKLCPKCQVVKPLDQFYKTRLKRPGGYCQQCRRKQMADYQSNHPEKVRAYNRKQREKDRKAWAAYQRQWRKDHPEQTKATQKKSRRANQARITQKMAEWRANHREVCRQYDRKRYPQVLAKNHVYRARRKHAPVVEHIDRETIFARDKWICHICHKRVQRQDASLDHIVALVDAGNHTASNVALAHKTCNFRKGARAIGQQMRLF